MSQQVSAAMQVKFQNNVELVLQQTKSVLEDTITVQDDASADKIKIKDLVGNVLPQEANERHGDTKYGNRSYDGVWVAKPTELYDADLIDNADQLGTAIGLQGTVVESCAATIARSRDRRILEGFYGSIISGKDGTITTPFPAGQIIPVTTGGASGNQKFNVAKVRAATKLLAQNYVDLSLERWMVLTADDNDSLLQEIPVTSDDFKGSYKGEVDDMGRVTGLLGWKFKYLELDNPMLGTIPALATDGSGFRKTPFYVKPGVRLNYWQRLRTMLDRMPGKLGSIQYFAGMIGAATRTQAGMGGIILNVKG
ncbi:phage capsid protein [Novosphingobium sp.]|uniref:phage capsid protein n=1 Tax=Novosphingobium sp. TaxID=1874826 RepID=UPI0038B9E85C